MGCDPFHSSYSQATGVYGIGGREGEGREGGGKGKGCSI